MAKLLLAASQVTFGGLLTKAGRPTLKQHAEYLHMIDQPGFDGPSILYDAGAPNMSEVGLRKFQCILSC